MREQQCVLITSSLESVRLETAARGPTFPGGSWRRLWPTAERQPAAFGLHRAALVVHAVALEAAQQVEEPLVPKGVGTGSLKKGGKNTNIVAQTVGGRIIWRLNVVCPPFGVLAWSPECYWCPGEPWWSLQACTSSHADGSRRRALRSSWPGTVWTGWPGCHCSTSDPSVKSETRCSDEAKKTPQPSIVEPCTQRSSYVHLVWCELHQLQVLHAESPAHPGLGS